MRLPRMAQATATNPIRRAPKRSAALPPGTWAARCVTNSAVVNSPTAASEIPYAAESVSATAPTFAMFHVTPAPSARAAAAARVSVLRTAETVRLVKAGYLLLALAGGAMLPVQAGINAQLARWVDSPVRAALISFGVGTAALLLLTLAAYRAWPEGGAGGAPWWVWTGGLLGAFYVFASIAAAPKLGAATRIGGILAGQAVAALVVDHFGWVGFEESPITLPRVLGLSLIAAGLLVIRFV